MRLRTATAAVLAAISLTLAAPALAHGTGSIRAIDIDGSQSGGVTIPGQDLVGAGPLTWDGSASGSVTVGGEDQRHEAARRGTSTPRSGSPSDMELDVDLGDVDTTFTPSG